MGISSLLGFGKEISQPIEALGKACDQIFTSDEERMQAQAILSKIAQQPQILQAEINKIEAAHRSVFVAGWRPAIGWICAFSLAWYFVVYPMLVWITAVFSPAIILPEMHIGDDLMSTVFALLGLGTLRTVEKVNGRAR